MALSLSKNISALAPRITTLLTGVGGTAPYTYSVESGGAGGTIDSVTGLYTAPKNVGNGLDVIKVTDDLGATSTATLAVLSHLELVCHILSKELDLASNQVTIYNQKFNIPKDQALYISVGVLSSKPFSNNKKIEGDSQVQTTNFKTVMSIDILSRGLEALNRKEEVVMALGGFISEQIQTANNFKVAVLPSAFVNLSSEDGAAIPYHYSLTVNMQYMIKKITTVEYFDTFEEPNLITNK